MKAYRLLHLALLLAGSVSLLGLQLKPLGWALLALSFISLKLCDQPYARDGLLIGIALVVIAVTPVNTEIDYGHMALMSVALGAAVAIPYLVSRFIYKDYSVRFPFHHGRRWYRTEVAYIAVSGLLAYLLLPVYLNSTGAYLNWPNPSDNSELIRLFIGTNALGIWDELMFVAVVLGLLKKHLEFWQANLIQAGLWTAFLYELGFVAWAPIAIFIFALLQGYIFQKTHSLLYVITIHLTVDLFLYLAIVNAHTSDLFNIFLT